MTKLKRLTASQEDYLETIYHVIKQNQVARAKEVAERLHVSRSSVTEAFRSLAKKGLINYTPYEVITLTPKGNEMALDVIRRHRALKEFFTKVLAVEDAVAESGACRIEHTAPKEIIERIIQFVNFIESQPEEGNDWINRFNDFCQPSQSE
jgi:DtxR family Mn-dependent transcriptional regulator